MSNSSPSRLSRAFGPRTISTFMLCAGALVADPAAAVIERSGDWSDDPSVTLDIQGEPRSAAVRLLADKAGWSLVFRNPPADPVDVHVTNQPASKVLDLILEDGDYVASRDGKLLSLAPAVAAVGPRPEEKPETDVAPTPAAASGAAATMTIPVSKPTASSSRAQPSPAAIEAAQDRVVSGSSVTLRADEVVKDLVVYGGSAEVFGTVTGDVVVMGGSTRIHESAVVYGDATAVGGTLTLDEGSEVRGDAVAIGGVVSGADQANSKAATVKRDIPKKGTLMQMIQDAGRAITSSAMLFVFGAVLFALATRRMESLQSAVAGRPMRAFALGLVGLFAGIALFIALSVTVIGIPIALFGLLLAVFAAYSGICAVLSTVGAALVRHRSENVYVHLAVGCFAFLLAGALPFIGKWVSFAVILTGMGAVIATRAAGFIKPRRESYGGGPYRAVEPTT